MRIAERGLRIENVVAPKGEKGLSREPVEFDGVSLPNAEHRLDSSLRACWTLKSVSLLRREAQFRFKLGLLGPGDVKLKRVALKVRRMIGNLPHSVGDCLRWLSITTGIGCPNGNGGRPKQ